jgi:hypothetical protein
MKNILDDHLIKKPKRNILLIQLIRIYFAVITFDLIFIMPFDPFPLKVALFSYLIIGVILVILYLVGILHNFATECCPYCGSTTTLSKTENLDGSTRCTNCNEINS